MSVGCIAQRCHSRSPAAPIPPATGVQSSYTSCLSACTRIRSTAVVQVNSPHTARNRGCCKYLSGCCKYLNCCNYPAPLACQSAQTYDTLQSWQVDEMLGLQCKPRTTRCKGGSLQVDSLSPVPQLGHVTADGHAQTTPGQQPYCCQTTVHPRRHRHAIPAAHSADKLPPHSGYAAPRMHCPQKHSQTIALAVHCKPECPDGELWIASFTRMQQGSWIGWSCRSPRSPHSSATGPHTRCCCHHCCRHAAATTQARSNVSVHAMAAAASPAAAIMHTQQGSWSDWSCHVPRSCHFSAAG
jgi:hypothetical protein